MMRFEPLGDQAVMCYCDTEGDAARLAAEVRRAAPVWCVDVVQAYFSVAVYYDFTAIDFARASHAIQSLDRSTGSKLDEGKLHVIPCCYDLGQDFERIEKHTRLSRNAVIALHAGTVYTIYAIGFCPGFPYLGYLPKELKGVPRLESPRVRVEEGSVGLTGRQTGIYTQVRPGGWNIIGRTPLRLVDIEAGYFPLRTGDRVQFKPIDEREFQGLARKKPAV